MGLGQDLPLELQLRPSELPDGSDVPYSLLDRQLCLQDDHILRPIVLTCAKSQTPVSNVYRHGNTADDLDVMEGISHHLSAFFRSR